MPEETKTDILLKKLKNNFTLSIIILTGIMVIAVSNFSDSLQKLVSQTQILMSEQIIVDGTILIENKKELVNNIHISIVDSNSNPLSKTAITGSDGKFILRIKYTLNEKLYLLIKKEGCSSYKVPLNKHHTNDLTLKFSCQKE